MDKDVKFEYENDPGEGSGALCYALLSIVIVVMVVVLFGKKLLHFVQNVV